MAVCAACTPSVSLRVPAAAVANLPLEQRLTLLDAESDVLAAQDARDAQEEKAHEASAAIEAAKRQVDAAEAALHQPATSDGNPDVAKAALAEANARRQFAERDAELERVRLATSDAQVLLAQARFELARAKEVDKAGQSGRYWVAVADYEKQTEAITAVMKARTDEEERVKASTDLSRKSWMDASQELAQLTGGGQGSVWVQ